MGRLENAVRRGHDPDSCPCVVCCDGRGEPRRPEHKRRAKHESARRGYLWLTHGDDRRVHDAASLLGVSCSEFVRGAIRERLDEVEEEIATSMEAEITVPLEAYTIMHAEACDEGEA